MEFILPRSLRDTLAMRQLDSQEWIAHCVIQTYGLRIGLRANSPEALEQMCKLMPPGWKTVSGQRVERVYSLRLGNRGQFHELHADDERLARLRKRDVVTDTLRANVQIYVAEHAHKRVFIHAGVVGWRGRAIVIPGHSMSGKSTLVEALVRAGAVYYSDEYAVLDDKGRVHAYPRAPQRRDPRTHIQTSFSIESIGGVIGSRPLPISTVVVSKYRSGARWRPQHLSAGHGVLALMQHAVAARTAPERVLPVLTLVANQAAILKSVRGEFSQVVESLLVD